MDIFSSTLQTDEENKLRPRAGSLKTSGTHALGGKRGN